MEGIIVNLFSKMSCNFGTVNAILIITFMLAIGYCIIQTIKSLPNHIKAKFQRRNNISLKKHQTFSDLDFLLKHQLKDVNTDCVLRKQLYIDIVGERIKSLKKALQKLVNEDLEALSSHEFLLKIQSELDDASVQSFNNAKINGVPSFVLQSFDEELANIGQFYRKQMKTTCYNNYIYKDNKSKMCSILDMLSNSTEYYMNILQQKLASFNGNITSLEYKGLSCHHCKNCVHAEYLQELKQELQESKKLMKQNKE